MKLTEFTDNLNTSLENDLATINLNFSDVLLRAKNSLITIQRAVIKLKDFIKDYNFVSDHDQISFFKNTKPKLFSQLFYYQCLFKIESDKPIGTAQTIMEFYETEIVRVNNYFDRNKEFYLYYKLQASNLDEIYFLKKEHNLRLVLDVDGYETDPNFTTYYDIKIAKFIAFEKVLEFIISQHTMARHLNASFDQNFVPYKGGLHWTGSKVSLVELLYALQSTGSCNNGTIDLKQMAKEMEQFFNIDLGNYYRVFQEMRIRKINRTTFLDQLKERLSQRMDETDENPKFK